MACFEVVLVEVRRHEANVLREHAEGARQSGSLPSQRVRVVDFEDGDVAQARQAIGAGVESGPEHNELLDLLFEGGADGIVDEASPRDPRAFAPQASGCR